MSKNIKFLFPSVITSCLLEGEIHSSKVDRGQTAEIKNKIVRFFDDLYLNFLWVLIDHDCFYRTTTKRRID